MTCINNIKKSFADVANEIAKDDRKVSVGLIYTVGACVTVAAITIPVALAATKALGAVSRIGCAAVEACLKKPTESKPTSAPDVKPECWGTGEETNNGAVDVKPECWGTGEETNNGAVDDKLQPDTITDRAHEYAKDLVGTLTTEGSTPWDAPLE